MEPRFVKKDEFVLIGSRKYTGNRFQVIEEAFQYIYDVWLPSSEYYLSEEVCADFEYYDERWDCQSSSAKMDLYSAS